MIPYLIIISDLLGVDDAGGLQFLKFLLQFLDKSLELDLRLAILLVVIPHYRVDLRLVIFQLGK